jgi:EAL domain-containing protein (putative c-di-GMP-specific phosphodiesterase class I)
MKDFYFDLVKLDRDFGHRLDTAPDNQVIAEALLSIARQFEMFSVAQGVESERVAEIFAGLGADCLQGFHLGVPRLSA